MEILYKYGEAFIDIIAKDMCQGTCIARVCHKFKYNSNNLCLPFVFTKVDTKYHNMVVAVYSVNHVSFCNLFGFLVFSLR